MTNLVNLNNLTQEQLIDLAKNLKQIDDSRRYNQQAFLFPENGPYPRSMYPKQMAFFGAGNKYKERAIVAGNRTGKTFTASTEGSYHLNGRYPEWWTGKRFNHPIKYWAVGKTNETTRDILQNYLLGTRHDLGTGMIPKEDLDRTTSKPGIPDAVQDQYVKHYTNGIYDGLSVVSFKSYDSGVESFMGTAIHVCHLDEEPNNPNIYSECLTRTMTTNGIVMCTFTPLNGLSETVLSFLPGGKFPKDGMGEACHDE